MSGEGEQGNYKVQIGIAVIGLVGVLATAIFSNWDKLQDQDQSEALRPADALEADLIEAARAINSQMDPAKGVMAFASGHNITVNQLIPRTLSPVEAQMVKQNSEEFAFTYICGNRDLRDLLDDGASFTLRYTDLAGKDISTKVAFCPSATSQMLGPPSVFVPGTVEPWLSDPIFQAIPNPIPSENFVDPAMTRLPDAPP